MTQSEHKKIKQKNQKREREREREKKKKRKQSERIIKFESSQLKKFIFYHTWHCTVRFKFTAFTRTVFR